jgi:hypothetical protein
VPPVPRPPDALRTWLAGEYLTQPVADGHCRVGDAAGDELVVFVPFAAFAAEMRRLGCDFRTVPDLCVAAGWIDDIRLDVTAGPVAADARPPRVVARLRLPPGSHRLVAIRPAVLDRAAGGRAAGGRPRIAGRPGDPAGRLKWNVYRLINARKRPGVGHKRLLRELKADRQFAEQVRAAGLTLDDQLVRAALQWGRRSGGPG